MAAPFKRSDRIRWPLIVAGLALLSFRLPGSDGFAAESVDFARDVYPVLQRSCFECHGARRQKAGLRLDVREDAFKGGDSGDTIVKGKPDESELVRRISLPKEDDDVMPNRGEKLGRSEVDRIRAWISAGAPWPDGIKPAKHWAYVAPVRPAVPETPSPTGNPIDAFVRARLRTEKLEPSPPADPHVLARRLYLDLIGLPPAPSEIDAFVRAAAVDLPGAVENLSDRLLASPQFGEKWARQWLDVARYADSHGFQRDDLVDIWPYRDWVIRAFNADMPFDEFTIEQLAGDLLPGATEQQRIATGFNRCAPCNVEAGTDPEENRVNQVLDRVNTLGMAWLGTTLACAQCHDHKYDPFKQRDYYSLFAFFNNTALEADRSNPKAPGSIRFLGPYMKISDPAVEAAQARAAKEIASTKALIAERSAKLFAKSENAPGSEERALTPPNSNSESADGTKHRAPKDGSALPAGAPPATDKNDPELRRLNARLTKLEKAQRAMPAARTLVMKEIAPPRPAAIFRRGDFRSPGDPVEPGTPAALHPFHEEGPRDRLALARWLVSRENPLVARVIVNRLWAEIFGEGIVSTPEDFGIKGDPPSHPKLLDWLAVEFMDRGWSRKKLLRLIVTSATYRQSSRVTPESLERDPRNRLLARGPRFRLSAEEIRDNALAIAGLLNLKQFGPPIHPPQPEGLWAKVGGQQYDYEVSPGDEQYRRGIYVVLKRGSPYPSFVNFDATSRPACRVRRTRSNTPLQALTLLNDPVYAQAARAFASRIVREQPASGVDARLDFAFRIALARPLAAAELAVLRKLYDSELAATGKPEEAWLSIASALLNVDETITKN